MISNNYEIIDNFLPNEEFVYIQNRMMSYGFPWHYNNSVTGPNSQDDISYYFTHLFVSTSRSVGLQKTSQEIELIRPILEKLSPKTLVRVKGNMYPRILNCENLDHTDYPFDCYGAIFYINTNNGKTIIDNNVEIVPVQNRMLIFNSGIKHRSIHCTDQKVRVNINFNYF